MTVTNRCRLIRAPATSTAAKRVLSTITRHRFQRRSRRPLQASFGKGGSSAEQSAKEPIIYWVDSVPEPIKSALIEGILWNQAFEAATKTRFRCGCCPRGLIPWIFATTLSNGCIDRRGAGLWSSIQDPRTQEILSVYIGFAQGSTGLPDCRGATVPVALTVVPRRSCRVALSRLLSAHRWGTIGLAHNFAASADDRASVMDYPHPLVTLSDDGQAMLDDAYDDGIGAWDKRAIIWGYQDFPEDVDRTCAVSNYERDYPSVRYVADEHARISGRSGGPCTSCG